MRNGYTIVLSGWDSISPKVPGGGPLVLAVPIAKNANGSPIVGPAMEEFIVDDNKTEKGLLTYPAAELATSKASLLVRTLVDDTPAPISADKWQFDEGGTTISLLPAGTKFEAGKLYNLVYQARDPKVAGIAYAAVRDVAEYLRSGPSSPVPQLAKIYATCDSQPCRLTHDFVELGFNEAEGGGAALDGVLNWEGGGSGIYLNYRFAQPYRTHRQRINRWFPEFEFPFTYHNTHDAVTGKVRRLARQMQGQQHLSFDYRCQFRQRVLGEEWGLGPYRYGWKRFARHRWRSHLFSCRTSSWRRRPSEGEGQLPNGAQSARGQSGDARSARCS